GVLPRLRQAWRRMTEVLYAGYAWSVLGIGAAALWSAVALLPTLSWRKAIARSLSQLLLRLFGSPVGGVGWSISPATRPVCLWSIMPVISIPWCWSQCCRPRS